MTRISSICRPKASSSKSSAPRTYAEILRQNGSEAIIEVQNTNP